MAVDISSYVVANRPLPLKNQKFDKWWDNIIDSGIMDLNYGIFAKDDYAMVVLPEIHSSDDTHENVLLRVINEKPRGGRSRQWWRYANAFSEMEGTYDVLALMFYNPSAPSLYLVYASDGDEGLMGNIPVHRKSGKQIMEMTNEMLRDSGETVDLEGKENVWSGFNDTSIRPIWILRKSSHAWFAAINSKEV